MIKLLDKVTIDKIAAGEVIERPSSVVKELLENSIDAGTTAITVEIKDGGCSFIRVTDNGCGIPKDEVRTAYMRHATSKIESAEDLFAIESLGFRGEALSTIAAVSQTEMITKTPEDLVGVKYVIHGGAEVEYKEVGVPNGTTIVVRNLFYNTPARKKFLKTPMTEGSYINDLVLKLALSHPEISFKFISNGQTKLDTSGNGKLKDCIYQLFGRDITSNLMPVEFDNGVIKISGFLGKPFISRGNRGLENYFVNNRYIKSNIINRAIEEGYKTFVMQHKFPFTVLFIDLPVEKCDVNVHPTKMEFKYDNEKELFEVVTRVVREALLAKEIIPKAEYNEQKHEKTSSDVQKQKPAEPYETTRRADETEKKVTLTTQAMKPYADTRTAKYSSSYNILESLKKANETEDNDKKRDIYTDNIALKLIKDIDDTYISAKQNNIIAEEPKYNFTGKSAVNAYKTSEKNKKEFKEMDKEEQISLFNDEFLSKKAKINHRIIGQLFETYWLIEYGKQLFIMDQHAAHEKVKYEELIANLRNKEIMSQQLMPPMIVTVSYAERQTIFEYYDLFMKIGYDIEEFGGNEFKINAVPSNLFGIHGREMFMEFVTSLMENSGYVSNDLFVKKLATMACKSAVKGKMKLSFEEADALIDQLLLLENPYTCPHGRPTIISMSETELEKKFKRII